MIQLMLFLDYNLFTAGLIPGHWQDGRKFGGSTPPPATSSFSYFWALD